MSQVQLLVYCIIFVTLIGECSSNLFNCLHTVKNIFEHCHWCLLDIIGLNHYYLILYQQEFISSLLYHIFFSHLHWVKVQYQEHLSHKSGTNNFSNQIINKKQNIKSDVESLYSPCFSNSPAAVSSFFVSVARNKTQ